MTSLLLDRINMEPTTLLYLVLLCMGTIVYSLQFSKTMSCELRANLRFYNMKDLHGRKPLASAPRDSSCSPSTVACMVTTYRYNGETSDFRGEDLKRLEGLGEESETHFNRSDAFRMGFPFWKDRLCTGWQGNFESWPSSQCSNWASNDWRRVQSHCTIFCSLVKGSESAPN